MLVKISEDSITPDVLAAFFEGLGLNPPKTSAEYADIDDRVPVVELATFAANHGATIGTTELGTLWIRPFRPAENLGRRALDQLSQEEIDCLLNQQADEEAMRERGS